MKSPIERTFALVALMLAVVGAARTAGAASAPEAVVDRLQSGLVALANGDAPQSVDERYARLAPLIDETHDLPFIAQFAVGRYWRDFSDEQRERFVRSFSKLSVMSYAARFVRLDSNSFTRGAVNDLGNGRVEVETSIRRADGSDIPLDYVLAHRDAGWKIINIVADGVSDLALKRAEYREILSMGSFDDLEQHLAAQIATLETAPH